MIQLRNVSRLLNAMPSTENFFRIEHVNLLRRSLKHWTKRDLVKEGLSEEEAAKKIFLAPFVVVSHGLGEDPLFTYGNQAALDLFEISWEKFLMMPSRCSAELMERAERARILETVSKQGFIENYSGVRISQENRRFLINDALVWNLIDEQGDVCGQAAMFENWKYLG